MPAKAVIAIGAHPDDIEFYMAGTLLLFKKAGFEIHYLNVASGNCGSTEYNAATTRSIRNTEARAAAKILGAHFHSNLTDDLEILYNLELLRALTAVIREVKPVVVLTHSPQDYMEDHMTTSRLAVTAAFIRGVPNYATDYAATNNYDCAIYHALPHSLLDPLRRKVIPEIFIDTSTVHTVKREALEAHKSQQNWLEDSQKMNSYIQSMENFSLTVGVMSKRFEHAEGWRRHLHVGFSEEGFDPLKELGEHYLANENYKFE